MEELTAEELEVTFIDACPPPLIDGDYQLEINQALDWKGPKAGKASFQSTYDFSVRGPRFTLDPSEIHAVYPPPNHRGHFQKNLPHMVLRRRSVPWERTLNDQPVDSPPYYPWLWLASLSEEEIKQYDIDPKSVPLSKVFQSPDPGTLLTPNIKPESGEDPASECLVIDVPVDLLQQLIPTKDDLQMMASARLVSIEHKELTAEMETGWFSVVLGNRFSANGQTNTQYLISLEGYESILAPAKIQGVEKVRLVVLSSWSFTNVDDKETFSELMNDLSVERLNLPTEPVEDQVVAKAFSMGYVPMNHLTLEGEHTVSWYRGPLLPMVMPTDTPTSYPNGDAATRYDPAYGMFDVSLSAAWHIGRLLCLQNASVASATAKMRSQTLATAHRLLHRSHLMRRLGIRDTPLLKNLAASHWFEDWLPSRLAATLEALTPETQDVSTELGQPIHGRSILGQPADPSGLREREELLPGLLNESQMLQVAEEGLESIHKLIRT